MVRINATGDPTRRRRPLQFLHGLTGEVLVTRYNVAIPMVLAVLAMIETQRPSTPAENEHRIVAAEQTGDIKVFEELLASSCISIGTDGKRHSKSEMLAILRTVGHQDVTATD